MNETQQQLLKFVLMLMLILAEYWIMSWHDSNLQAKLYHYLARFCYGLAFMLGAAGIEFEHAYYKAVC
jgi:hypothetical protein